MNTFLSQYSKILSILAASVLVVGCSSEDETLPAEQTDGGELVSDTAAQDAAGTTPDLGNPPDSENAPDMVSPPDSDGSAAAIDCSGAGDVCEEPCRARYVVRYDRELNCLAPREEWLRAPDSPGLLLVVCDHPEGNAAGQAETCLCNEEGECGWSSETVSLPVDSPWTQCDSEIWSATFEAVRNDQYCPPGTFD